MRDAVRVAGAIVQGERGAGVNDEIIRVLDPDNHASNPRRNLGPFRHAASSVRVTESSAVRCCRSSRPSLATALGPPPKRMRRRIGCGLFR